MDQQRRNLLLTILGVLVVIVICVGSVWLLSNFVSSATLQNGSAFVRDLLIILLAIESLFVGAFLLLMIWQIYQLVRLLREEVIPLLHATQETVEHVKHTTTFVGQSVSAPIISAAGMAAGVKELVDTLRGKKTPQELVRRERYDG